MRCVWSNYIIFFAYRFGSAGAVVQKILKKKKKKQYKYINMKTLRHFFELEQQNIFFFKRHRYIQLWRIFYYFFFLYILEQNFTIYVIYVSEVLYLYLYLVFSFEKMLILLLLSLVIIIILCVFVFFFSFVDSCT